MNNPLTPILPLVRRAYAAAERSSEITSTLTTTQMTDSIPAATTAADVSAKLEPITRRISELMARQGELTTGIHDLTARRAQLVADAAEKLAIDECSSSLLDLEIELAPLADAIAHLTERRDVLRQEEARLALAERLTALRAEHETALAAAHQARTALRMALVKFAATTLPPHLEALDNAIATGRRVTAELQAAYATAGTSHADAVGNWPIDRYEHGAVADAVNALTMFSTRWAAVSGAQSTQAA